MRAVTTVTGRAYPFGQSDVDTDVIIAAEWLKALTREGMGSGVFAELRRDRDTVFDDSRFADAPILIAGRNFGCGSSREHAVWALLDFGIEVVIAPSFSDIFLGNAFKNGLLTIVLDQATVCHLLDVAKTATITVDLPNQTITTSLKDCFAFAFDSFRKHCLLHGLDEIALTLASAADISSHERRYSRERNFYAKLDMG